MADAIKELQVRLGLDVGNTTKSLDDVSKSYDELSLATKNAEVSQKSLSERLNATADKMASVGKKLSTFVTLPLLGLGVAAVKSAADMEQSQAAFEVLLGSADKARKLLGDLKKFADTTPFAFDDLAQGTKTLLSFGVSEEKVLPITKQLGDIALGNAEKYKSLALVYGQISSTGRLMGQDLLQLINVGFNPLQVISKKTGESMAELKKRMEDGKISSLEVAEAFKIATSEGGQFYEGTKKLAQTFSGQLSTFKDNLATLGRQFGEILLPILTDVLGSLSKVVEAFSQMDDESKKTIIKLVALAASTGPALVGISGMIKAVDGLSKAFKHVSATPIILVAVALAGLAIVLSDIINNAPGTANALNKITKESESLRQSIEQNEIQVNDILGAYDKLSEGQLLNEEQVLKLKALYPELSGVLVAGKTSIEEFRQAQINLTRTQLEAQLQSQKTALALGIQRQQQILGTLAIYESTTANNAAARASFDAFQRPQLMSQLKEQTQALKDLGSEINSTRGELAGLGKTSNDTIAPVVNLNNALTETKKTEEELKAEADALKKRFEEANEWYAAWILEKQELDAEQKENYIKYLNEQYEEEEKLRLENIEKEKKAQEEKKEEWQKSVSDIQSLLGKVQGSMTGLTNSIANVLKKLNDEVEITFNDIADIVLNVFDAINQIMEASYDKQIELLEAQMQADLEAAGVAEETAVEKAEAQLAAAIAEGDAETIAKAKDALKRAKIEEEYQKKIAQLQYEQAHAAWALQIVQAIAGAALAVIMAFAQLGPIAGAIAAVGVAITTGIQLGIMAANEPQPPAFASGVTNFVGGMALVGEQGPELVNLPRGSDVIPAGQTAAMLGGKSEINFILNSPKALSVGEAQQKFSQMYRQMAFESGLAI